MKTMQHQTSCDNCCGRQGPSLYKLVMSMSILMLLVISSPSGADLFNRHFYDSVFPDIREIPKPRVYSVENSSSPAQITNASIVKIYDPDTLELQKEVPMLGIKAHHFNKVPFHNYALINHFAPESFIEVFDYASNEIVGKFETGLGPRHVSFSKDGDKAYTANYDGNSLTVIDLVKGTSTTVATGIKPNYVYEYETPHGAMLFAANFGEDTVTVIDKETLSLVKTIQVGDGPFSSIQTPDGKYMLTPNTRDHTVSWVDLDTLEEVSRVSYLGPLGSDLDVSKGHQRANIRISPEKKFVWIGNQQGGVYAIFDLNTRQLVTEIQAGFGADIAFFPGGGPAQGYALLTNRYSSFVTVAKLNGLEKPTFEENIPVSHNGTHYFSFSKDWKKGYVSQRPGGAFSKIDLTTLSEEASQLVGPLPDQSMYVWCDLTVTGPQFRVWNEKGQVE